VTLIAGMKCSDGIVIAPDTEHTDGVVRFQEHELNVYPSKRVMWVRDISVGGDAFGFCEDVNRAYVIR